MEASVYRLADPDWHTCWFVYVLSFAIIKVIDVNITWRVYQYSWFKFMSWVGEYDKGSTNSGVLLLMTILVPNDRITCVSLIRYYLWFCNCFDSYHPSYMTFLVWFNAIYFLCIVYTMIAEDGWFGHVDHELIHATRQGRATFASRVILILNIIF